MLSPLALLCVGTYEQTLCGWEVDEEGLMEPIFNHPAHIGPIKAVASAGKFLVSGGNDEEIRIFNARQRKEIGTVMRHQGAITCLKFHGTQSLLSGSDDSNICLWRCKDWECLSTLHGHRGGIIDIDVHSSGKVMLSCARDNTIRLWDLVKGKSIYQRKQQPKKGWGMAGSFNMIKWKPQGDGYCCAMGNDVFLFDTQAEVASSVLEHERNPLCATYVSENMIATGGEDKIVRLWDTRAGKIAHSLPAHKNRVRAVVWEAGTETLATCCSDGDVRVFKLAQLEKPACQESTRARVTSACASSLSATPAAQAAQEDNADGDSAKLTNTKRPIGVADGGSKQSKPKKKKNKAQKAE